MQSATAWRNTPDADTIPEPCPVLLFGFGTLLFAIDSGWLDQGGACVVVGGYDAGYEGMAFYTTTLDNRFGRRPTRGMSHRTAGSLRSSVLCRRGFHCHQHCKVPSFRDYLSRTLRPFFFAYRMASAISPAVGLRFTAGHSSAR